MKKLTLLLFTILLLASLPLVGQTHEIRRPTADSTTTSCPSPDLAISPAPSNVASPSMPNAYDASGTSTSSSESVTGGTTNQHYTSRLFTGFSAPSGSYTSVTINVNASATDSNGDIWIGLSQDSGSTFNIVKRETNTGGFAQATFSIAFSTGTAFSSLQVAVCAMGNPSSGTANATVFDVWTDGVLATAPNAPTGLSASVANGAVNLSWTDNATDETSYKVDRCVGDQTVCTSDSVATLWTTLGANTTSTPETGMAGKTTYTFWVKAHNAIGDSSPTNAVTLTLPGASVTHVTSP